MEKSSTRAARKRGSLEGGVQKEKYLKLKAFAIEHEKENFSKLFIIHEKTNWWKMIGHSAIIFHFDLSKRAGMRTKLVDDSDYDLKTEDGVINIKNIYELDSKLESISIRPLEIKPEYRVYNIGKKYTVAEIENLRKAKELEWEKINSIVVPETIFPVLFMTERELLHRLYFTTKLLDPYARDLIARPMVEKAVEIIREYSFMANGEGLGPIEYLELVEDSAKWITSQMAVVSELRIVEAENIYRILRTIEKLKKDIEGCRRRTKT